MNCNDDGCYEAKGGDCDEPNSEQFRVDRMKIVILLTEKYIPKSKQYAKNLKKCP